MIIHIDRITVTDVRDTTGLYHKFLKQLNVLAILDYC